jgi:phosphoglycerate dehydrogenase-like enzyme
MRKDLKVFILAPNSDCEMEYRQLEEVGLTLFRGRCYEQFRDRPYSEEELVDLCRDVDAILASHRDRLPRRVLETSKRLRLVVYPFAGVDRVDVAAATELGILVCNSPSAENAIGTAEATIGLMLALFKRLKHNENLLRQGRWGRIGDRGDLLCGKTVGIIGLGHIGRAVAHRLSPWGVRLLAHSPHAEREQARALGVTLVDLDTLLQEADLVSVHVVVTPETKNLLGEREFRMMRPNSYLINTSRGEAIYEPALARAIEEGWIAGAALDVFWQEPLPLENPLRRLDPERVILTPHKIGQSEAAFRKNHRLAVESLLKGLRGEVPENTVNRESIPRWRTRLRHLLASQTRSRPSKR